LGEKEELPYPLKKVPPRENSGIAKGFGGKWIASGEGFSSFHPGAKEFGIIFAEKAFYQLWAREVKKRLKKIAILPQTLYFLTMKSGRVTMTDVANACGLSVAAVSYVLKGVPKVSEESAERVWLAVDTLGYKIRHQRNRGTRQGSRTPLPQGQILFLVGDTRLDAMYTHQLRAVARGAEKLLAEFGYELIQAHMPEGGGVPLCVQRRQVKGILFRDAGCTITDAQIGMLRRTPTVAFFAQQAHGEYDMVGNDDQSSAEMAVRYLAESGCRSLTIINADANNSFYHAMSQAALFLARKNGWLIRLYEVQVETSIAPFLEGLSSEDPTAGLFIIGYNKTNTPEEVETLLLRTGLIQGMGRRIVASSSYAFTHHATCFQDMHALGRSCAEQLMWRISHPDSEPCRRLMPPRLVTGRLVAPSSNRAFFSKADKQGEKEPRYE
jgi:DNA-binding LacI/PurR family transcriptional regulator